MIFKKIFFVDFEERQTDRQTQREVSPTHSCSHWLTPVCALTLAYWDDTLTNTSH